MKKPRCPTGNNVKFGLKLFSDICLEYKGDCFKTGDIRVAFGSASKFYAPPADEIFYVLTEEVIAKPPGAPRTSAAKSGLPSILFNQSRLLLVISSVCNKLRLPDWS